MRSRILLSALLAIVGNSMVAFGQLFQKLQIQKFHILETTRLKIKRFLIWIGGIILSNVGLVLIYISISIGSASIVGAMNGFGLIPLVLLSHFWLNEKINRYELIGIFLIAFGVVIIPIEPYPVPEIYNYQLSAIWLGFGIVVGILLAITFLLVIRKHPAGTILGLLAGSLTGFSNIFQKVSSLAVNNVGLLSGGLLFVWIGLLFLSFTTLQFAYRGNRAVTVIPAFNSFKTLVPIIGGVVLLGEGLNWHQWLGVATILTGTLMISTHSPNS